MRRGKEDLTDLDAGTYSVIIEDGSQCTFEATVIVFEPTALELENTLINDSVDGQDNGNINLDVIGGTPPYSYSWDNGENEPNITNLAPGSYSCTISDANGCILEVGPFVVDGLVSTKNLVDLKPASLFPNPANQSIQVEFSEAQASEVRFEDGYYFLILRNKKGSSSSSFVIQR